MATAAATRRKPTRRLPPEILTDGEVLALMRACGESDTGLRNQALIAVMYRSGLRVAEALALYPKDVDAAAGTVRVLCGKGGRSRTVGIDDGGLAVVARWAAVRAALGLTGRAPLLCTRAGAPLGTGYMRRLFSNLAARAGVTKRVHAHGFRHTHAAQLRSEGVDIGIISKQLGHRSITTTACYLDHICPYAVIEAVRARAWMHESLQSRV
jgi:integrase/recombinase XerC